MVFPFSFNVGDIRRLLGGDPLEGVLDATLLVCGLKLLAADLLPLAATCSLEAAVVHAVVVEDNLYAAAAIGDLIRLVERLGELDALELDGIIESLNHGVSLPRG